LKPLDCVRKPCKIAGAASLSGSKQTVNRASTVQCQLQKTPLFWVNAFDIK